MSDRLGGLWAGASIHEVAQVAAAGAAISPAALKIAALMKLTRVVLLAPTVAIAAWMRGGEGRVSTGRSLPVPGFVLAFLALVVVRTVVSVSAGHPQHRPLGRDLSCSAVRSRRSASRRRSPRSAPPAGVRCCSGLGAWVSRCWCRSACSACRGGLRVGSWKEWRDPDLNRGHLDFQSSALPG